jgi:hypothetical protein
MPKPGEQGRVERSLPQGGPGRTEQALVPFAGNYQPLAPEEVGRASLETLAGHINVEGTMAEVALNAALHHAREADRLLLEAKGRLGHGEWLPWLKANVVSFSVRSAQQYMVVAERWEELMAKCAEPAHLTLQGGLKLLAGKAPEGAPAEEEPPAEGDEAPPRGRNPPFQPLRTDEGGEAARTLNRKGERALWERLQTLANPHWPNLGSLAYLSLHFVEPTLTWPPHGSEEMVERHGLVAWVLENLNHFIRRRGRPTLVAYDDLWLVLTRWALGGGEVRMTAFHLNNAQFLSGEDREAFDQADLDNLASAAQAGKTSAGRRLAEMAAEAGVAEAEIGDAPDWQTVANHLKDRRLLAAAADAPPGAAADVPPPPATPAPAGGNGSGAGARPGTLASPAPPPPPAAAAPEAAVATPSVPACRAPELKEHGRLLVVRDDLLPGGTKYRALLEVLPALGHAEYVYGTSAWGYAQVALALACHDLGLKATIFCPKSGTLPRAREVEGAGAKLVQVPFGRQNVVEARAREHCEKTGAYLFQLGFDLPVMLAPLTAAARSLDVQPTEVWCAAGSGTLCRALQAAWPEARHVAVQVGKPPKVGAATLHKAPEKFEKPARQSPPFPSCANYDAKVWQFLKPRLEAAGPDDRILFWNVAG